MRPSRRTSCVGCAECHGALASTDAPAESDREHRDRRVPHGVRLEAGAPRSPIACPPQRIRESLPRAQDAPPRRTRPAASCPRRPTARRPLPASRRARVAPAPRTPSRVRCARAARTRSRTAREPRQREQPMPAGRERGEQRARSHTGRAGGSRRCPQCARGVNGPLPERSNDEGTFIGATQLVAWNGLTTPSLTALPRGASALCGRRCAALRRDSSSAR
jgi:hypothetical protein